MTTMGDLSEVVSREDWLAARKGLLVREGAHPGLWLDQCRHVGRPVALSADKIEYARLLKAQGASPGIFATKTDIPTTSLSRYLVDTSATVQS